MSSFGSVTDTAYLARLDERVLFIIDKISKNEEEMKRTLEQLNRIERNISNIEQRVTSVEGSLAAREPTIKEFIVLKHKVTGIGKLGKYLWYGFSALIIIITFFKDTLLSFFERGQ